MTTAVTTAAGTTAAARPDPPLARHTARTVLTLLRLAPGALLDLGLDPVRPLASTTSPNGLQRVARWSRGALERFGVTFDVTGTERVPADGGLVFMWNQVSHLDHLLLGASIPRPFACIYNNEVARFPLYGNHLRRRGHFWVDRRDEAQWRPAIERAASFVQGGGCVLVSPEGTRSWDGELLPFKRGAFQLVERAARPVVCVTFVGAGACLPRGRFTVTPGHVRAVLSEPIPAPEATPERIAETFLAARYGSAAKPSG